MKLTQFNKLTNMFNIKNEEIIEGEFFKDCLTHIIFY